MNRDPQPIGARQSRRAFLGSGLVAAGGVLAARGRGATPKNRPAAPPKDGREAWSRLAAGNRRFRRGKAKQKGSTSVRRAALAEGQAPFAIVLSCADSRVPPEIVFDQGLGDLFTVRIAGNTASDPAVLGSIEYGAVVLGSVLLVVLGHEDCGAVKAAIEVATKGKTPPGKLDGFVNPIVPAVTDVKGVAADQLLQAAVHQNVRRTATGLGQDPTLAGLIDAGKLMIVGAEYRLKSGKVDLIGG